MIRAEKSELSDRERGTKRKIALCSLGVGRMHRRGS